MTQSSLLLPQDDLMPAIWIIWSMCGIKEVRMHEANFAYTQDPCVIKMTHREQFLMDSAVSTHGQNEEATITK